MSYKKSCVAHSNSKEIVLLQIILSVAIVAFV